jgi:hypothetical protein
MLPRESHGTGHRPTTKVLGVEQKTLNETKQTRQISHLLYFPLHSTDS